MTIQEQIVATANLYGVPPEIALSIARAESDFNQAAMGSKGEIGIFQLMPSTAAELGVNASVLEDNITGGITYLKQMFDKFGDWGKAVAAYNAGPRNVSKGKIPSSTQEYVSKVFSGASDFLTQMLGIPLNDANDTNESVAANYKFPNIAPTDTKEGGYGDVGMIVGMVGLGIVGIWLVSRMG